MLGTGETGARGRQLHTLQQFVKELIRGVGIGIVTHEDTRSWMIEYGVALIGVTRSEEHTSELQSHSDIVCRLLLEKKKYEVFFFGMKKIVSNVYHLKA